MAKDGWPKAPTIYEIYPRSFLDTNGDGIGDLKGVVRGLDHVASLGVDAIWLCPFFVSPLDDGGYDVADHRSVDPRHGTMADFDAVIEKARGLGLRVIVDMVFNHTSIAHPLFQASLDGDEEAAAHYVWRDPKPDGTQPNNWLSQFGPPAWTWNHRRRQYYFHQFLDCQPNLDLRHEGVQRMHRDTMRFWIDRGVSGFRLDAVTSYLFTPGMPDNPPADPVVQDRVTGPNFNPYTYQDHVHDMLPGDGGAYMERVRDWVGPDIWLLGESTSGNRKIEMALSFTDEGRLDATYTTAGILHGSRPGGIKEILEGLDGEWRMPWWFSCHDHPRHVSSMGDESAVSARFYAALLAVLPGALMIYQGEELGLPQPQLAQWENTDPFDLLYWPDPPGREGPRVPMPWTEDGPARGFTDGTPWSPMRWAEGLSVAAQDTEGSVLDFYRRAMAWRRESGAGVPERIEADATETVLELTITAGGRSWRAVFNYSADEVFPVPAHAGQDAALATGWDGQALAPWGAAVWAL